MQSATSFKTLYEEHYGFVWATVCRFGVTPMLAEDAVHDTFIVAYRRRAAFDGHSPKSWLYSIGRRVASNYRRTRGRRESRHTAAADLVKPAADLESDVNAKVSLERFLATLSPDDRELFVLSELDGLTGPELASTLGRKLPTVYGRVRVLRQRFAQTVTAQDNTLQAAKRDRPRAKASGWLLLQPALSVSVVGGSKLAVGVLAVAAVAAVFVGVVATGGVGDSPRDTSPAPEVQVASATAPAKAVQPAPEPEPAPDPGPAAAPGQAPPSTSPAATTPTETARAPRKPASPRRGPATVGSSAEPDPEEAPYDLAADTKLLQDANRALRGDQPKRAVQLLAEHERRFPSSAQPDLRVAIWVGALCAQGRTTAASARAQALRKARPNSPMLLRIEATCAGKKTVAEQP